MKTLIIVHHQTSAYHQQANGMIERPHRHLKEALKSTDTHRYRVGIQWRSLVTIEPTPTDNSFTCRITRHPENSDGHVNLLNNSFGSSNSIPDDCLASSLVDFFFGQL